MWLKVMVMMIMMMMMTISDNRRNGFNRNVILCTLRPDPNVVHEII